MKYVILLVTASTLIFVKVYVLAANNLAEHNLVSCRSSQEELPSDSTSDRSGA